MKHFLPKAFIPAMAAAIVLTATATSHAQWFGLYWGSYWPSYSYSSYYPDYYSSYYTPSYSTYYSPSYYTTSYVPTYTASYTPSVAYYAGNSCCSPCTSCVSCNTSCSPCTSCNTCCSPCTDCGSCDCSGDCALGSSSSSSQTQSGNSTPARNRTFIEENDRGTGNQQYEAPAQQGTGDGFSPRKSNGVDPDPLDSSFGTSAGGRDQLRFKVPSSPNRANTTPDGELEFKNPTRRVKNESYESPSLQLLKLDEKITSRAMPQRTRLVERRSWQEPVIARNGTDKEPTDINIGWVPMPAPARLVQK